MTAVVGRDRELAEIASFLELADGAPRILLLEGDAGIGKTTLWEEALRLADKRDFRVLRSRPTQSEAQVAYAGDGQPPDVQAAAGSGASTTGCSRDCVADSGVG